MDQASSSADRVAPQNLATDVRVTREQVGRDLDELESLVQRGLAGAWHGASGEPFQRLMECWHDDVETLLQAMNDIADLVQGADLVHGAGGRPAGVQRSAAQRRAGGGRADTCP